jgi:hypothetical protein
LMSAEAHTTHTHYSCSCAQTGTGKTHTMGMLHAMDDKAVGVVPQ